MTIAASRSQARRRRWAGHISTFVHNRLAVIGLIVVVLFAGSLVVREVLWATVWEGQARIYDPATGYDAPTEIRVVVDKVTDPDREISRNDALFAGKMDAKVGDVIETPIQPAPPSTKHWFGTDPFGRDVFSMVLAGATPAFVVGITAAISTALVGSLIAAVSAVFRGWVDAVLSKLSDVALLLPAPLAMIIIGAGAFEGDITPFWFGLLYGLIAGLGTAAIVLRSHALSIMGRPFIDAARVAGAGRLRVAFRHLLPHLIPLAGVSMFTAVVGAVVAHGFAAWLSFADDVVNWGAMMFMGLSLAQGFGGGIAWNVLLAGALTISLFTGSFYLVSLGIRDVALPRTQSRALRRQRDVALHSRQRP
ncbi:MAG: ABC transporter permease subunit [Acidimicrobiia bacterium]